jgi:hypothetical protein
MTMHASLQGSGYPSPLTAAQQAVEKPRLAQQIDQLQKVIAECHDAAGSLENAVDRILGPVPQDAAKESAKPPVSTIEMRFAEAIGRVEVLAHRLRESAQRLNTAV